MANVLGNSASSNCYPDDAASVKGTLHPRRRATCKTTRGVFGFNAARMGVNAVARGHSRQWEGPS